MQVTFYQQSNITDIIPSEYFANQQIISPTIIVNGIILSYTSALTVGFVEDSELNQGRSCVAWLLNQIHHN